MRLFSYVVVRDYGFAPNPFGGFCTLATCKPLLRKQAQCGDWVMGTGSVGAGLKGRLIYAMRVDEKLTFDEYWNEPRFSIKKPVFNGSLKHSFGDNIYHRDPATGNWIQENSHHSLEGGGTNQVNLVRDTKWPYVLISHHHYYFGDNHIGLPRHWVDRLCHNARVPPHIIISGRVANNFVHWIEQMQSFQGIPLGFEDGFTRFKG